MRKTIMQNHRRFLAALATLAFAVPAQAQSITFTRNGPAILLENEPNSASIGGFGSSLTIQFSPALIGSVGTGAGAYSTWWSEWGDEPYQRWSDYGYGTAQAGAWYSAQLDTIYGPSVNTILVTIPIFRTRAATSWAKITGWPYVDCEAAGNSMHEGPGWAGCRSFVDASGEEMSKSIPEEVYDESEVQLYMSRTPGTSYWTIWGGQQLFVNTSFIKAYARTVVSSDDWYGGQVQGWASSSIADAVGFGIPTSTIDPGIVYGTASVPRLTAPLSNHAVKIQLRATGSSTDIKVLKNAVFLQGNRFWIGAGGLSGNHDVIVSRKGCLRKKVSEISLTPNQLTNATFTLVLGDVNGDNVINSTDSAAVSARIGATSADPYWFDPGTGGLSAYDCDVDEDGAVDAEDLDIVMDNLNQVGN